MNHLKNKYKFQYDKEPQGAAKYLWQYPDLKIRWNKFLSSDVFINKRILDFGSGPGIALREGLDMGLDITGLDIDTEPVYKDMNLLLGVNPILYDGVNIPDIESFDIIIFHWSFIFDMATEGKMSKRQITERAIKLIEISNKDGLWFVSPKPHYDIALNYFDNINLFMI